MSTKNTRSGGKYGGSHTTVIPAAGVVCDIAHDCPAVTRISPGRISAGLPSVGGKRRVKISDSGSVVVLMVRDNVSLQEIRVYADNIQAAKEAIARGARNEGLHISFGKKGD